MVVSGCYSGYSQLRPDERNARGGTRLRGPEVWGPSKASEFDTLVSAIRGESGSSGASERGVRFNGSGKQGGPLSGPLRGL